MRITEHHDEFLYDWGYFDSQGNIPSHISLRELAQISLSIANQDHPASSGQSSTTPEPHPADIDQRMIELEWALEGVPSVGVAASTLYRTGPALEAVFYWARRRDRDFNVDLQRTLQPSALDALPITPMVQLAASFFTELRQRRTAGEKYLAKQAQHDLEQHLKSAGYQTPGRMAAQLLAIFDPESRPNVELSKTC